MAPRITHEHRWRVETQRLVVEERAKELGREIDLEVEGLVGHQGKGSGMGLAETKTGKPGQLPEDLLRCLFLHTLGDGPGDEKRAQSSHGLFRPAAAHSPAQAVGVGWTETGNGHRHPDHLLLEDDHPHRLGQHRFQGRMEVADRLQSLPPAQVGMHHPPLDGPRPYERDLDDDILKTGRLHFGLHLGLGTALHLKTAHRIGALQHVINGRIVQRQVVQIRGVLPLGSDVSQGLLDSAQGAQGKEIDLDQTRVLDAVLVPLYDDPARHRRPLQGHHLDQR